jgi:hypothetical protein
MFKKMVVLGLFTCLLFIGCVYAGNCDDIEVRIINASGENMTLSYHTPQANWVRINFPASTEAVTFRANTWSTQGGDPTFAEFAIEGPEGKRAFSRILKPYCGGNKSGAFIITHRTAATSYLLPEPTQNDYCDKLGGDYGCVNVPSPGIVTYTFSKKVKGSKR